MTEEEWEKLLKNFTDHLEFLSTGKENQLASVYILGEYDPTTGEKVPEGTSTLMVTHLSGEEKEIEFAEACLMTSLVMDAFATVFSTEVWMAQWNPEEELVQPADNPNRREAIMLLANHREFGRKQMIAFVEHDQNGQRVVREWKENPVVVTGRFGALVSPSEVPKHVRKAAHLITTELMKLSYSQWSPDMVSRENFN